MAHPIADAQTALKAIVTAIPSFASVSVMDGGPTENEDITRDTFWFNDTQIPQDGWASLGAQRRRVRFLLGFTIAVRREGDDELTTRGQALDYFEDFMLAVKANPSLGGVVQQCDDVTGTVSSVPVAPLVWGAYFTGTLSVTSKAY